MSSDVETLMEMGFSRNRAEKALHVTKYKSVQVAMDWLFAHSEDADIDDPFEAPKGYKLGDSTSTGQESSTSQEGEDGAGGSATAEGTDGASKESGEPEPQAKSLKCDECGKRLRAAQDVQVHAARTGHQSFSESAEEIKALTEEEKREQVVRLQEKLAQRQKEKREQEKKELFEKEKLRRKKGRELTDFKHQHEVEEMKKLAEMKKREKLEDKLARQRVKDQIARDRVDRAAKFGTKSSTAEQPAPAPAAAAPVATTTAPKKEYDSARLQIRLTNGSAITNSFGANESLAAVRLYIELNRTDGVASPFTLMTPFPRKVFTEEDMEKPLKELGLVPSAVLTITKPQ